MIPNFSKKAKDRLSQPFQPLTGVQETLFTSIKMPTRVTCFDRDPLALTAVAAICGIIFSDYFLLPLLTLSLSLIALSLWSFFHRSSTLALLSLSFCSFAFIHTLDLRWIESFPHLDQLPLADAPSTEQATQVTVIGIISSEVSLNKSQRRGSFILQIEKLDLHNKRSFSHHKVRVRLDHLPKDLRNLSYGDQIRISGQIHLLPPARNPGSFSPQDFYRRAHGIVAEIHCHSGHPIVRISRNNGNPLIRIAHTSRDWLAAAITRDLEEDPDTASIITAMVLGSREDTPEAIEEQFRLSGALHIFAVSGLHIGLFGLIIWQVLKLLRIPRRTAIWLIIPAILFYATITGLRPSAIRAAMMGSILLFSFVVGRQPRLINSLGLSALLLLAYDSQQLFLPGFQLSFAVLGTIALLAPVFMRYFSAPFTLDPFIPHHLISPQRLMFHDLSYYGSNYLSVSFAAWLGSLPLIIYHFQLVTPASILSNCLLIPMAMLILSLAFASLCASLLQLNFLSILFNNSNWLAAKICSLLTAIFAALPGGHFHYSFTPVPVTAEQPLYIAVLDIPSGGASQFISVYQKPKWLPQSQSLLIDTASERSAPYIIEPFLRHRSINVLQSIFLTHNDHQHIGALPFLSSRYHPRQLYGPAQIPSAAAIKNLSPAIRNSLKILNRGEQINFTEEVIIKVLFPPENKAPGPRADDNSLVLQLHYSGWVILLMGDAGFETEKWLLQHQTGQLASDLLIKTQHSTAPSGLKEFITAVRPQAIIASHQDFPAQQRIPPPWRAWLRQQQIPLLDQSQSGAVEILISPTALQLKSYLGDQSLTLRKRKP